MRRSAPAPDRQLQAGAMLHTHARRARSPRRPRARAAPRAAARPPADPSWARSPHAQPRSVRRAAATRPGGRAAAHTSTARMASSLAARPSRVLVIITTAPIDHPAPGRAVRLPPAGWPSRTRKRQQQSVQHREGRHAEPERPAHPRRQRRDDARLRVQRAPHVHRHVDERHVGHAEERDRRDELLRPGSAVLPHAAGRRRRSSTAAATRSAARPTATTRPTPCAPTCGPVTRTIDAEQHRELGRRDARRDRRPRGRLNRNTAARDAADERRQEHHHRRRHVEVEDLLHQPHRRLVRRAARSAAARPRTSPPRRARLQRTSHHLLTIQCPSAGCPVPATQSELRNASPALERGTGTQPGTWHPPWNVEPGPGTAHHSVISGSNVQSDSVDEHHVEEHQQRRSRTAPSARPRRSLQQRRRAANAAQ